MAFDPENHLTQIGVSGSPTFTAGYNGDGLRAWKQTNSNGRTYFVYDGAVPLVNTFGAAGLLSRRSGGLSGPTTFYTFDPQGNVCQRLDANATVTSTDTADAFGVVNRLP